MEHFALHVPVWQRRPPPQLWPSDFVDQAVVDDVGVQTWHAFAGFTAFAA